MLLEVLGDQRLQQRTAGVVERPAVHEDLAQGPSLVGDPGGEGGQQVVAADEVVLQGQDAEEQVAAGLPRRVGGGRSAPGPRRGVGVGLGCLAEDVVDQGTVAREAGAVLVGRRPLAPGPAQLQLQQEQLA